MFLKLDGPQANFRWVHIHLKVYFIFNILDMLSLCDCIWGTATDLLQDSMYMFLTVSVNRTYSQVCMDRIEAFGMLGKLFFKHQKLL